MSAGAQSAATMMLLHKRGAPAVLLPEFLREVFVGQRTGLPHVSRGETPGVTFRSVNGEIVSGSSSDESGRLGEQALAFHIREMLFTALLWREASLLFEDQELPEPPAEDLTLRSATAELILELVRCVPGREAVRQGLGDLDRPLVAPRDR